VSQWWKTIHSAGLFGKAVPDLRFCLGFLPATIK